MKDSLATLMKGRALLTRLCGLLLALAASTAVAQTTVLYQQNFGTGNGSTLTLAQVGWTGLHTPSGWNGIYVQPGAKDGLTSEPLPENVLYFGASQPAAGIFYTTTGAGSGTHGNSAFTSINPAQHTNLNIAVWTQWSWQGGNLTNYFALQVGGAWYVHTNKPLTTLQQSSGDPFYKSSITYSPTATNWNTLSFDSSGVTIGARPAANLSGDITGVGVVVLQGAPGSWDYANFQISSISNTTTMPPLMAAAPLSQTVYEGAGVSYSVHATGSEPFAYYWSKDGVPVSDTARISGSKTATLTITNVTPDDLAGFTVIVSNSAGWFDTSTNGNALLSVNTLPSDYLYVETFPFVGPLVIGYPLEVVGWSNAISQNPNRLYQAGGGDGAAYAFESTASTKAFYVTTSSDKGVSGVPFKKINPSAHPAVSFAVDIAPSYQPAGVRAHIAVQMNGSAWYANSSPLPVDTATATDTFTTYRQQFDPVAANWNALMLSATDAVIGAPVGANLTGEITGAGIVFVFTGSGNFNIDNFAVTTTPVAPAPPSIVFAPLSQTVSSGAGVSFAVNATGNRPFSYYWYKGTTLLADNARVSGAKSNILTILNASSGDAGDYSVIVSNTAGTDNSVNYLSTVLTVNTPEVGLLYEETFPYVGPGTAGYPLNTVGWENAIPNNSDRLYQIAGSDGAGYAYQAGTATTAFFSSTNFDSGRSGLRFPSIPVRFYPNLTIFVDVAPAYQPQGVQVWPAVQMDGGPWYVSATPLPVDTSIANATFATYTAPFNPAAGQWRVLGLTAGSGATVGDLTTWSLDGVITGAGVVVSHSSEGTIDFDNFKIIGTGIGGLTIVASGPNTVTLSWVGNPAVRLQSSTKLGTGENWVEVPNTAGQSTATVQTGGTPTFFRLVSP